MSIITQYDLRPIGTYQSYNSSYNPKQQRVVHSCLICHGDMSVKYEKGYTRTLELIEKGGKFRMSMTCHRSCMQERISKQRRITALRRIHMIRSYTPNRTRQPSSRYEIESAMKRGIKII
jgi:hypothetical protein